MKKLLTLLFTLVLAITVACINTNIVKAETVNYGLILNEDGTITKSTGGDITIPELEYDSARNVWKMENFNFDTTADKGIEFKASTTLEIKGTNNISVNSTSGKFDFYVIGTSYSNMYNINITIKSFDGTNNHVLNISNNTSSKSNASGLFLENWNQGNTLTLESGKINTYAINNPSLRADNIVLKDAVVYSESNFEVAVYVHAIDGLKIEGSGIIKGKTTSSSAYFGAVEFGGDNSGNNAAYYNDNFELKGTVDGSDTKLQKVTVADVFNETYGCYEIISYIGTEVPKYMQIGEVVEPTPTPTPDKKDESCEKVIGPTWHWNNTKGVCEEYATVGTYTR